MKLIFKVVLPFVAVTFLLPLRMVAEQTLDIYGYGWWGGWDVDYATAHYRFSLADGSTAVDGTYRVYFDTRGSDGGFSTYPPVLKLSTARLQTTGAAQVITAR